MYSLKVSKSFVHPDTRVFEVGHDCKALSAFEAAELVTDYPDSFEAADEITADFLKNKENVKHLSDAVQRSKSQVAGLSGDVKARKK